MQRLTAFCALACSCSAIRLTGKQPADAALQCQRGDRAGNELAGDLSHVHRGGGQFDDVIESLLRPTGDDKATAPWQRGEKFPLSVDSIQHASAPYGHTGAPLRLRRAVSKLVQRPSQTLTIVTFGGSMTRGQAVKIPWPGRLERLARGLNYTVKVHNVACGGCTSKWGSSVGMGRHADLLKSADIVLVEYSLNDIPTGGAALEAQYLGGRGEVTAAFKVLMELLIGLPNKPAVMALETLYRPGYTPHCDELDKTDIRTFPHWEVLEEFSIPTISYALSTCPSGSLQWFPNPAPEHPNATTHDLIARTVLGSLLLQMDIVSSEGISGMDHPVVQADPVASCLAAPLRSYSATGRGGFPSAAKDGAWVLTEDVKGKPGWIVPESAPSSEIAFLVTTQVGWVQVEFLGSYANIGKADVWIDSYSTTTCLLDGLWDQRISQSRFSLMKVNLPPGNHTLHFRSRGDKFKILGIVTC